MRGIQVLESGTFTSIPISDGLLFIEGKDIVTVKGSDDEMATVTAQGITKLKDSSKVVLVPISIILLKLKNYHF
jgi:hypothetical protein